MKLVARGKGLGRALGGITHCHTTIGRDNNRRGPHSTEVGTRLALPRIVIFY
jgi:hypothetical protein